MRDWQVSRLAARRFLLEAVLLGPVKSDLMDRPGRLGDMIHQLAAVQIDPVARVGRNQDLVLTARFAGYRSEQLDRLLRHGAVFEYRAQEACVLPMEDYPLFEGVRQRLRERLSDELARYHEVVDAVLARIREEGPLPARAFVSADRVYGYWDNDHAKTKATSHVLNLLYDAGYLMVAQRDGLTRIFDVPDRVVPQALRERARELGPDGADQGLMDKYLSAYHLVNGRSSRLGWGGRPMAWRRQALEDRVARGTVHRVTVEGVKSPYYVRDEDRDRLGDWMQRERGWDRPIHFLPPLDNVLWDRDRLVDLFDFHYRWEVYVPADRRTFGVYAMPILVGDRLVGRIDPELKRAESTLVVHKVAWEPSVRVTPRLRRDVTRALEQWAARLGAHRVLGPNDTTTGLELEPYDPEA